MNKDEKIDKLALEIASLSDNITKSLEKDKRAEAIEWLAFAIDSLVKRDFKEAKRCIHIAMRELNTNKKTDGK